jgi:glutaredoxin
MDKIAVVFTMKTCPHCQVLKEMLESAEIDYIDRDIYEYEEEYDLFVEATGNDFVPAFMLIENPESETPTTGLYAPDRDFEDVDHGLKIIKEFFER